MKTFDHGTLNTQLVWSIVKTSKQTSKEVSSASVIRKVWLKLSANERAHNLFPSMKTPGSLQGYDIWGQFKCVVIKAPAGTCAAHRQRPKSSRKC